MALLSLFVFAIASLHGVYGQCGYTAVPTGTNLLQTAGIYMNNSQAIYRVSIDSLTSSGYTALVTSGQAKLATADNANCSVALCMMPLGVNQNTVTSNIFHQWNWLGNLAPAGYTLITPTTAMYCVRFQGDCGANVPLYRYYKVVGLTIAYAYSFDSSVAYAGYTRELVPVCYGWSTTTPVSTCGDGIVTSHLSALSVYQNAASLLLQNRDTWTTTQTSTTNPSEFNYQSYAKTRDLGKVAVSQSSSSDTFVCNCLVQAVQVYDQNTGILGTAMAPGAFSRFDHKWYLASQPETNLIGENYQKTGETFYCVLSKGTCGATLAVYKWFNVFNIDTVYTIDGDANPGLGYVGGNLICYIWPTSYTAPAVCTMPTAVTNGQLSYIQAGSTTDYLQGTVAILTCNSGYGNQGVSNITCLSTGVWSPTTFGTCDQTCPALTVTNSATITYTKADGTTAVTSAPYFTGYLAKFTCTGTLTGAGTAACAAGAWTISGSCS